MPPPLDDASAIERLTPILYHYGGVGVGGGEGEGGGGEGRGGGEATGSDGRSDGGGGEEWESGEEGAGDIENRAAYHGLRSPDGMPLPPEMDKEAMQAFFGSDAEEEDDERGGGGQR
jgi:hypothetical protein